MAARFLSKAETEANRFHVLATFRHLLRATGLAFRGDKEMLRAARRNARDSFANNRLLGVGEVDTAQAIEHAQGVTQILRENVVQGKHKGGEKYKLNIHEHTQRLDNETAGELKGTTKSFKQIKGETF